MKESEIWREVGRRMETRTCKNLSNKNGIGFICYEFDQIYKEAHNDIPGYSIGNARYREYAIIDERDGGPQAYAYNDIMCLKENHEGRTLAAYLFALIAEEEEKGTRKNG
jgi:hypothetical protein